MSPKAEDVRVVPASVRDDLTILNLYRDVFGEDRWFITAGDEFALDLAAMRARIEAHRSCESSGVWVARGERGAVWGVLFSTGGTLRRMRHTSKIEVMVRRDARGRGVGSALLRACVAWADASKVVEKLGLAVFADNEKALQLYRKEGFREEGRRLREYRMDDGSYRDDVLMYRYTSESPTASSSDHSASRR